MKEFTLVLTYNECVAVARALHYFGMKAPKQRVWPPDLIMTLVTLRGVADKLPDPDAMDAVEEAERIVKE